MTIQIAKYNYPIGEHLFFVQYKYVLSTHVTCCIVSQALDARAVRIDCLECERMPSFT